MINLNQPLINRNGYNYLNQSVEGDMLMINSRFSPTNDGRFGYMDNDVKKTNSSIKINPESEDVVMPLENTSNNTKIKAGRMCSTLNNFYKKSHIWKPKQKHINKAKIYSHENDYTSSDKVVSNERKRLKKVKNQFLITSHPYLQDRSSFQSRCGSDLKFNWKSGIKKSPNGSETYEHQTKNTTKPFIRNGLPPVILKTAQCFYKNKSAVREWDSDEFVKIQKPKNIKNQVNVAYEQKRGSASHLLEIPQNDYNVSFSSFL